MGDQVVDVHRAPTGAPGRRRPLRRSVREIRWPPSGDSRPPSPRALRNGPGSSARCADENGRLPADKNRCDSTTQGTHRCGQPSALPCQRVPPTGGFGLRRRHNRSYAVKESNAPILRNYGWDRYTSPTVPVWRATGGLPSVIASFAWEMRLLEARDGWSRQSEWR